MSIRLQGIKHSIRTKSGSRINLRDINMQVHKGERVALLGAKGSGLDQVVNIICGSTLPARGIVSVTSEISWPICEKGFLQDHKSLVTNLRFLARIYEINEESYVARMNEIVDFSDIWNTQLGLVSKDIQKRFAFALGVSLPFDIYIFESLESLDKQFTERARQAVEAVAASAGILVVGGKGEPALQHCQTAFVLDEGKISHYEDIDEAVAHLDRLRDKGADDEVVEEAGDESDGSDVYDII